MTTGIVVFIWHLAAPCCTWILHLHHLTIVNQSKLANLAKRYEMSFINKNAKMDATTDERRPIRLC